MNGVIGQRRHRLNDESVDALVRSGAMLGSFKLYKKLKEEVVKKLLPNDWQLPLHGSCYRVKMNGPPPG